MKLHLTIKSDDGHFRLSWQTTHRWLIAQAAWIGGAAAVIWKLIAG